MYNQNENLKVSVDIFKNDYYSIIGSQNLTFDVTHSNNTIHSNMTNTLIMNVITKKVNLNPILFSLPQYTQVSAIDYYKYALQQIKYELNKEAITKIRLLANSRTKIMSLLKLKQELEEEFKNYSLTEKREIFTRRIAYRLIQYSSYIAANGRMGSAQYALYSSETLFDLEKYIDIDFVNTTISDIKMSIDENIENHVIILGRKNELPNPGVYCVILTDKNNNIIFDEIANFGFSTTKQVRMFYSIFDIGSSPENQYCRIETKDIADYRLEKLLKIKAKYG